MKKENKEQYMERWEFPPERFADRVMSYCIVYLSILATITITIITIWTIYRIITGQPI